jgi:hypothetical protein
MFRRTLLAALLASAPALAQPVAAPDCTVAAQLDERGGLALEVTYRCRATQPLAFEMGEARAAPHVGGLEVEQSNGIAEARYRFDLSGFARAVDSTSLAVQRGNGVLATLGAGCSSRAATTARPSSTSAWPSARDWCSRPACLRLATLGGSPAPPCASPVTRRSAG